jgi:hypothetical protein
VIVNKIKKKRKCVVEEEKEVKERRPRTKQNILREMSSHLETSPS